MTCCFAEHELRSYPHYNHYPSPVGLAGRFAARDRLNNVSSHLSPRATVVNVNLPLSTKPEADTRPLTAIKTEPAPTALPDDTDKDQTPAAREAVPCA